MKTNTNTNQLHFTKHQSKGKCINKMDGMVSLNTSTINNDFCLKMHDNVKLICSSCYAYNLELFRKQIVPPFYRNGKILTRPLKDHEIPHLKLKSLRFNAIGELLNKQHYFNLVAIAEANPNTICTLWTKRPEIAATHRITLPNLIHIYSSPMLNTISTKQAKHFDKIFTVFNTAYIRDNNVSINCQKQCATCNICYTHNDIKYINEKIR